jgi:RNA-directed DNA polymerase
LQKEDVLSKTKPFDISQDLVMRAFKHIKANAGAAGIDKQTVANFELNLKDNLYKLWNRLASGSYFPPAVKAVPIPKRNGGVRILGIPTVADRIAQMVIKLQFEPNVEPHFLPDSYGYRPNKSALEAIGITRQRCWKYGWVVEFDIKGFFDNLNHELLIKAVKKHTDNKWIILYIERWLKAPLQLNDGSLQKRNCGVPQGGVISPVLSNLFLHYVFDLWMHIKHPATPWCRYADDGLVHCKTQLEACQILAELTERFEKCGLKLHPDKSRVIYCKDGIRQGKYPNTEFNFLGYCFRARRAKSTKRNTTFTAISPAVSKEAQKSMRAQTRKLGLRNRTDLSIEKIAEIYNPILRGWIQYYGEYNRSSLYPVLNHFNNTIKAWVMHKYKKFKGRPTQAGIFLEKLAQKNPSLFAHWRIGMIGRFA